MTKTHYTIPDGCTGFTVEQEGSRLVIEFIAEPKRWRAEEGGDYFCIDYGHVALSTEEGDTVDDCRYNSGNYYRTREEAEFKLKSERWRGCIGDNYYCLKNGDVHFERDGGFLRDDERYESGNYFETYEEAEAAFENRKNS